MQPATATPEHQPVAREIWVTSDGAHWRCLGQFATDADSVPYLEAGWGVWCRPRYESNPRPRAGHRVGPQSWLRALTAIRPARRGPGSR